MRKVLLVLALVGASFAGGAVVNGPGLQWVKGCISDRMRQSDAIPTLDVDDGSTVAADPSSANSEPQVKEARPADASARDVPSAPSPILGGSLARRDPPVSKPPDILQPAAAAPEPVEAPAEANPISEPPALTSKNATPLPLDTPKTGWEDAPGPAPSMAVLPKATLVKIRLPATDSAVSTVTNPPPLLAEPPPLTGSMPAPSIAPASAGWPSLQARMKTLGVSRFWIEGTPGGAVTFRCIVPADTAEAANRQFEAEGDDEFKAADSALRRVAVWKAAERVSKSR